MSKLGVHEPEAFGESFIERFEVGAPGERTAPIKMSRFSVEPGITTPWDEHSVSEIWVVMSGSGVVEVGKRSEPVSAGEAFYMAPHEPHRAINNSPERLSFMSLWWPT